MGSIISIVAKAVENDIKRADASRQRSAMPCARRAGFRATEIFTSVLSRVEADRAPIATYRWAWHRRTAIVPRHGSVRILNAGAIRPGLGSAWRRPAHFPSSS